MQQFFKEKTGRMLYQDELENFIQDHVVDLGKEGRDTSYGHGLFVLPDPQDIDVKKYILGGVGDMKNEIIYNDIENHWAKDDILAVEKANSKLFDGFPDGSFKPDEPITRGQLAKIIRVLMNY